MYAMSSVTYKLVCISNLLAVSIFHYIKKFHIRYFHCVGKKNCDIRKFYDIKTIAISDTVTILESFTISDFLIRNVHHIRLLLYQHCYYIRDFYYIRNVHYIRDFCYIRNYHYIENLHYIRYFLCIRDFHYIRNFHCIRNFHYISSLHRDILSLSVHIANYVSSVSSQYQQRT